VGGHGSGRTDRLYRRVEDGLNLSIFVLKRDRVLLTGGIVSTTIQWRREGEEESFAAIGISTTLNESEGRYRLTYTMGSGESVEVHGLLLSTRPKYGGLRWWFGCPFCSRKCAMLHLPPGSKRFACRTCHRLRYTSQSETNSDRLLRRARKLYRRAGSSTGGSNYVYKPKGMHWRTFDRLMDAAEEADLAALCANRWLTTILLQPPKAA
jgi:hypothetical protein